jgi:hypothetical protein
MPHEACKAMPDVYTDGGLIARIILWNKRWSIAGDFIVCTICVTHQSMDSMSEPFVHADECPQKSERVERPWLTLASILNGIPKP